MFQKRFKEAENTAVFTTKFVVVDRKEITKVYHHKEDGAWEFFSADIFDNINEVVKIVGLGRILNIDNTILELAGLPEGYCAYRNSRNEPWSIREFNDEE